MKTNIGKEDIILDDVGEVVKPKEYSYKLVEQKRSWNTCDNEQFVKNLIKDYLDQVDIVSHKIENRYYIHIDYINKVIVIDSYEKGVKLVHGFTEESIKKICEYIEETSYDTNVINSDYSRDLKMLIDKINRLIKNDIWSFPVYLNGEFVFETMSQEHRIFSILQNGFDLYLQSDTLTSTKDKVTAERKFVVSILELKLYL